MSAMLSLAPSPAVQLPPHDTPAELAVVAACILSEAALSGVVDFLRPSHFFVDAHSRAYEACLALRASGTPVDVLNVATWLRERSSGPGAPTRLAQVGGMAWLTGVLDASPAVSNVRSHAESVVNAWRVRQAIRVCQRAESVGYLGAGDVQAYLDGAAASLLDLARQSPTFRLEANIVAVKRMIGEMREAAREGSTVRAMGIPTGLAPLDALIFGLRPAKKYEIVALPRVGKTAFAQQLAIAAASQDVSVYFASTEVPRDDMADRQIAHLSGVNGTRIMLARTKNVLNPAEWVAIASAATKAARFNLFVDDDPGTIDDFCSRVRSFAHVEHAKGKRVLAVLDSIQRIGASPSLSRASETQQIAHATKAFSGLCRELKIAGIETAQQRDLEVDRRTGKRPAPQLGDVAWCKHVDKEADVSLYLWRSDERDGEHVTASVRKQRAGDEGEFQLVFDRACGRFCDARLEANRQHVEGFER